MATAIDITTGEQIDAALERARHLPDLPSAVSAKYEPSLDIIVLELLGGRRLILPRQELQGLEGASLTELSEIEIHGGTDIAWPKLDVDHYLPHLLAGSYGSAKWMRRLELLGIEDMPLNSPSAIARHRLSDVSYSLFEPSSHVEGQVLQAVSEVRDELQLLTAFDLRFDSKVLRLAALTYHDTIEVTLLDEKQCSGEVPSAAWQHILGRRLGFIWVAVNQQGYLDTVLLGFSSTVVPDIAVTTVASELVVRRLAA